MIDRRMYSQAVDALDILLSDRVLAAKIRRDIVEKGLNPLNRKDLIKISARISRALEGATADEEAKALRAALNALDVDWATLSDDARDAVIAAAKAELAAIPELVMPAVAQVFADNALPIVTASKDAAISTFSLNIETSLTALDNKIGSYISRSQAFFVTTEYGKRAETFEQRIKDVVAAGADRGAGSADIVRNLTDTIEGLESLGRGEAYWEMLSLAFVNRARVFAELSSFQQAGIEKYRWDSVLDEVTTEICRFMDGKEFSVGDAVQRLNDADEAESADEIRQIHPWVSMGRDDEGNAHMFYRDVNGDKQEVAKITEPGFGEKDKIGTYEATMTDEQLGANGISLPPIHGCCRSNVVPA